MQIGSKWDKTEKVFEIVKIAYMDVTLFNIKCNFMTS